MASTIHAQLSAPLKLNHASLLWRRSLSPDAIASTSSRLPSSSTFTTKGKFSNLIPHYQLDSRQIPLIRA